MSLIGISLRIACFSASDHPQEWAVRSTHPHTSDGGSIINLCLCSFHYYICVIFISTESENIHRSGIYYVDPYNHDHLREAQELVSRYRSFVDLVVFSLHWGPNYQWENDCYYVKFAKGLIDAVSKFSVHDKTETSSITNYTNYLWNSRELILFMVIRAIM